MKVILTHDIDSIKKPFKHIWQRRERFTLKDLTLAALGIKNLYNNIEEIVALEDKYGFRSTFFVPVFLFNLNEILDILKKIQKDGWEVQLHYVHEPIQHQGLFKMQKMFFEKHLGKVKGVRSHMLIINKDILEMFRREGIIYDSSYRSETLGTFNPILINKNLVEIPVGLMDADIFGRLKLGEKQAWKYILWKIKRAEKNGAKYFTILFHQESYKMKGGKLYKKLVEYIAEKRIEVHRSIDVARNLREKRDLLHSK